MTRFRESIQVCNSIRHAIQVYNFVIASYFFNTAGVMRTLMVTDWKSVVQEITTTIPIRYLLCPLSINVYKVLVNLMSTQALCFNRARKLITTRHWEGYDGNQVAGTEFFKCPD